MQEDNSMGPAKVLLTGFEAFGGSNYNISEDITSRINLLNIENVELSTKILSVDEYGSKSISRDVIGEKFDCIVHLGFSNKATQINLECRAMNKISMEIPDNSGRKISTSKLIENSKDEFYSTSPYEDYLVESPIKFKLSFDAGTFVCNETYFYTLRSIYKHNLSDRFGRKLPCIFIHLPSKDFVPISDQISFILWILKKMTHKEIIDVVAGIIRNDGGEILVAKRDLNQPHPRKWEFPGGKLKIGESNEDALKRELLEELNLDVDIISNCAIVTHLYENYFVNLHSMNAIIREDSGTMKLNVHEEIMWVKEEDLLVFDWLEANKKLVKIIQNHS